MKKIILILILLLIPSILGVNCPKGLINDSYPGSCGAYVDTNQNQLCDYSEVETIQKVDSQKSEVQENFKTPKTNQYYFLLILGVSTILYLTTYFLSKKNKISNVTHKRIWNLLLLISFILTALSSIMLVLKLEYGINLNLPLNITFWHIETGIVMIIISIFHTIWHLPYFKSYLK